MKMITAGPVLTGVPDLDLLGVPDSVHNRAPGPELFPGNFNPGERKLWDRQFKNEAFMARLRASTNPEDQWAMCVKGFLTACRAKAANPFQPHYLESENGRINTTLSAQRKLVHKTLTACDLTDVRYVSGSPAVKRLKKGFALTVSARMNTKGHKFEDSTVLIAHLTKKGFVATRAGVYEKALNPETKVCIDTRKDKPVLSYEIASARHPFIKSWNVVTKAKYEAFVVSKIFRPLTKASPNGFTRYCL